MTSYNANLFGPRAAMAASLLPLTFLLVTAFAGCSGKISTGRVPGAGGGAPGGVGSGAGTGGTGTGAQSGTAGTGGQPATVDACLASPAPNPGRSPLRRLNRDEYRRTIRDLLPSAASMVDVTVNTFPLDEEQLGFTNNADALSTGLTLAQNYISAAETFATAATANLTTLLPCDPVNVGETVCAQMFVTDFGQRSFRRPLTTDEITKHMAIYTAGRPDGFAPGISLVIQSFLESPYFLYRAEKGALTTKAGVAALNHYEMATRLSYFLWGTMPDAQLFTEAAASKLGTVAEVEAVARRMLADPKAKQSVGILHQQWLAIGALGSKTKDATMFSAWTPAIVTAQFSEASAFLDYVFWNDGRSEALFTAPYTFVNAGLATFYGMTPPSGTGFVKTNVDVAQRSGILTQGSLMAILSYENQTSPIHRGKFVRNQFLCQELTPPPPEIAAKVTPPPFNPALSTRERFAAHESEPVCAGCHRAMDPIGLGFENFDPVGRWRTKDGTFDVDATGEVMAPSDVTGKFNGPVELGAKLAQSQQVRECIVTQWFRFANGRAETTDLDPCTLQTLKRNFEDAGHDMREIPINLAVSDTFRFRSTDGGGP
jgi:hypothetical protein